MWKEGLGTEFSFPIIFHVKSRNFTKSSVSTFFILFHTVIFQDSPSELPIISLDVFLAISVALLVAFSTIVIIPILSAPFLTPSKNVFQPRPSMARKNMLINIINNIRDIIPITSCLKTSSIPFNDFEKSYILAVNYLLT